MICKDDARRKIHAKSSCKCEFIWKNMKILISFSKNFEWIEKVKYIKEDT